MTPENRTFIQNNYLRFVRYMFERVNGSPFVLNWHHKEIAKALTRVILGDCKRLIINIPPRYSKTEMGVVNFVPFCMGHWPDSEFIHTSYSKRLATNNAYNARTVMQHEAYQEVFPDVLLDSDSKAKDEWRTTNGGVMYATGSEGTLTGYGAGKMRPGFGGAIIIDDPHKPNEVESDTMRQNVIEWFQNTLQSRTNSDHTPIIIIMQRLHVKDLAGWLQEGGNGEDWDVLSIPVEDEAGVPLWPFKHDRAKLDVMKEKNAYTYAGQYLQRPAPREGAMIKRHWPLRYINPPLHPIMIVQSWDTASKEKEQNDPSVCTTWAITRQGYYLLHVYQKRMEYPELKRMSIELFNAWSPTAVLIEDKSTGQSLLQELKGSTLVPAIAIEPEGDKFTRMSTESGAFEGGLVFLPESAPWLDTYEGELFFFPKSEHKDQIDSTSQFLRWARNKRGEFGQAVGTGERSSMSAYEDDVMTIDEDSGFGRLRSSNNLGGF